MGQNFKQTIAPIFLGAQGKVSQKCSENKVKCVTNQDCEKCTESLEGKKMKCVTIPNKDTKDKIETVCAPEKSKLNCEFKYGGLPTWSGWSNPDRMEWDCLCAYPAYAGNEGCTKLNADVCNNGTFNWDTTKGEAPSSDFCICNSGYTKVKKYNDQPICVPNKIKDWYNAYK